MGAKMTTDNIEKLIQKNQKLLFILGVATSVILEIYNQIPECEKDKIKWLNEAIEDVVYNNKPLPTLPERISKDLQ